MLDIMDFGDLPFREEDLKDTPAVSLEGANIPGGIPEKWGQLVRHNARIREVWEGQREYPTDSERAYAIAGYAGAYGLTKEEAAAVLVAFYAEPGRKRLHRA